MYNEQEDDGPRIALAAGLLIVTAAALRFANIGKTLFEDETWVATLLQKGGWAPHTYLTPPLFYAIGRAWTKLFGASDDVLRQPAAFIGAACCALPLFAPKPRLTRLVWATLLAFSSPLLFYSGRVKQYTLEAFVATALIVLFLRMMGDSSPANTAAFFALGALAVTSLYCSVILLGAMSVLSVKRPRFLAGFFLLFVLFGLAYKGWLAPSQASTNVHGDMVKFFEETGRWATSPAIFLDSTKHWLGQAMNLLPLWWLVLTPLALLLIVRERPVKTLALAVLPPLAAAVASVFHFYPYGEVRLMVFTFPALYLLVAEAIEHSSRRVPALVLLVAPFILSGVAREPYNSTYMRLHDHRAAFAMVANGHRSGEPITVTSSHAAPLLYYYPQLAPYVRVAAVPAPSGPGWYLQASRKFRPEPGLTLDDHELTVTLVR